MQKEVPMLFAKRTLFSVTVASNINPAPEAPPAKQTPTKNATAKNRSSKALPPTAKALKYV